MAMGANIFNRTSFHLSGFVAVSIVGHLLLLGYWFQSNSPMPITNSPLPVIMLQLQDEKIASTMQTSKFASKSEPAKPAHSNPDTKTVTPQLQTVESVVSKEQTVITALAPESQSDKSIASITVVERETIAATSAPPQIVMQLEQSRAKQPPQLQADNENISKPSLSLNQLREQIRGHLHENLARHFHYPRLARKRGWQGEVLLTLKIESDGVISRILITKSTGYALLDETAINTVKKISNLKNMGQRLNGRSIEMELPVIYRLTNS